MGKLFKLVWIIFLVELVGFAAGCSLLSKQELPKNIPPAKGVMVPVFDINTPGRTSLLLKDWATRLAKNTGVSVAALQAYGNAAEILRQTRPQCGIGWTTIAGVGAVESKHGTHGLSRIDGEGNIFPHILGPVLDGSAGVMLIKDTDKGKYDGNSRYDRAVGPFQFLPETWQKYGRDANGDKVADPNNIDDAALTAGVYLCHSGGNLASAVGWRKAVLTYNNSEGYLVRVRDAAARLGLTKI